MQFTNKPILGMVHLSGSNTAEIVDRAITEIQIYKQEGLHGCIIENYHSDTYHVIKVLKKLRGRGGLLPSYSFKVGINILPNEFRDAFMLAELAQCDFIQVDNIAGSYEGVKQIDWIYYKSVRSQFPDIKILGGVWPKYYTPIKESVLANDIEDGITRCDAVVVTGAGTGKQTPIEKITQFKTLCGSFPLIVGAGMDKDNVVEQLRIADGAIVGSAFKPNGLTSSMIERRLIQQFMNEYKKI